LVRFGECEIIIRNLQKLARGGNDMAVSTCIKCGGSVFETKEMQPQNSNFKLNFIQCASCGGVVGVTDYYNIGGMLETLGKKMGVNLT
jgi:hypothetical protein